jgi:hypothetical protein
MNISEVQRHGSRSERRNGTVQQLERAEREAVLVEDAAVIRMMGLPVLEAPPSRRARYEQVDPFILVHEGRFRLCDFEGVDTKHPHRGFDNVWYVIEGSASTGHSTRSWQASRTARYRSSTVRSSIRWRVL